MYNPYSPSNSSLAHFRRRCLPSGVQFPLARFTAPRPLFSPSPFLSFPLFLLCFLLLFFVPLINRNFETNCQRPGYGLRSYKATLPSSFSTSSLSLWKIFSARRMVKMTPSHISSDEVMKMPESTKGKWTCLTSIYCKWRTMKRESRGRTDTRMDGSSEATRSPRYLY